MLRIVRRLKRFFITLFAAVLVPWSAFGEIRFSLPVFPYSEKPKKALEAQVEGLLASQDLKDKTWGAYLAGQHGMKKYIAALERILEPQPFGSPTQRSLMLRAALDGLIQLEGRPDPETLLPHFEAFPDEVLIVLSSDPQRYRTQLLVLIDRSLPEVRWMAISNLLAEIRAPGFAAGLLSDLRVTASVQVRDGALVGFGGGAGSGCGGAYGAIEGAKIPIDYPPPSAYGLLRINGLERGAVAVAPGPYPVFSRRLVSLPGTSLILPVTSPETSPRRDRQRLRYLAAMLHLLIDVLPLQAFEQIRVDWLGPEPLLREVASFRERAHASHAQLLEQLMVAELLTLDEAAGIPLDLEIEVVDIRGDRSEPLPRIPSL